MSYNRSMNKVLTGWITKVYELWSGKICSEVWKESISGRGKIYTKIRRYNGHQVLGGLNSWVWLELSLCISEGVGKVGDEVGWVEVLS